MTDINVVLSVVLAVCGGISVVGGAIGMVVKLFKPYTNMKQQLEDHDDQIKQNHELCLQNEESNKLQLKCLLRLVDHEITGNSIDKLKAVKTEIQDYLLEK